MLVIAFGGLKRLRLSFMLDEAPSIPQWEAWNTANSAAEHHLCLGMGWDASESARSIRIKQN